MQLLRKGKGGDPKLQLLGGERGVDLKWRGLEGYQLFEKGWQKKGVNSFWVEGGSVLTMKIVNPSMPGGSKKVTYF